MPASSIVRANEIMKTKRDVMLAALPACVDKERFYAVAMAMSSSYDFSKIDDANSIVNAVYGCVKLGLTPDKSLGHVWIVPYKNRKTNKTEAQLQIGYKGFVELATRGGRIAAIHAEVVYDNCRCEVHYGTDRRIAHQPWSSLADDSGKVRFAYSTWIDTKTGTVQFNLTTAERLNRAKESSQSASGKYSESGPWNTDEVKMIQKTAIRDAAALWPMTTELGQAIQWDTQQILGQRQSLPAEIGDGQAPQKKLDILDFGDFAASDKPKEEDKPPDRLIGDGSPVDDAAIDAAMEAAQTTG